MLSGYELNITYIKEINSLRRKNLSLTNKIDVQEAAILVLAAAIICLLMFIGLRFL